EDLKAITTRSGVTLARPSVSSPPLSKEVDRERMKITDQVLIGSANNVPPLVVQPSPVSTSFSTISSSKMPKVTKDTEPPPQNGPPLMVRPNVQAPQMIEKLCQPSINGRGEPITSIPIQATDFGLRNHMIKQVQNTC
nr:reverse transcriptase domain-containing protein [Tanacetum cinerariifolium]